MDLGKANTLLLVILFFHATRAYQEIEKNERGNLHPGRVILYRPIKTNPEPEYDNYNQEKYNSESYTEEPRDIPYRRNEQDAQNYKLPASKYENDYFQPPRPLPTPAHERGGFTFPDDRTSRRDYTYWPTRATVPQNVVDYNQIPRERPRYQSHHPAVITYDNGDLRENHHRPTLLHQNIPHHGIPVPGSGVIIASGPGGVKHIIHDLRPPPQVTTEQQVTHAHEPDNEYKTGFVGHRFTNKPQTGYKGVPVYIGGGTFGGKEYDPRFVTLYRQVIEENQKKLVPGYYRVKVQPFNPSPTFRWFSELDPIYHQNIAPTLTTNGGQLDPFSQPTVPTLPDGEEFPDSINAQLPPPTDNENHDIPYETNQLPNPTREPVAGISEDDLLARLVVTHESVLETSSKSPLQVETSISGDSGAVTPKTTEPPSNPSSSVSEILNSNAQTSTKSNEITMTTVTKSVSTSRDPKADVELVTDGTKDSTTDTIGANLPLRAAIEQVTEAPTTSTSSSSATTPLATETLTPGSGEDTVGTTVDPLTDIDRTDSEQSATMIDSRTESPSTTVTELALTTLNYLVMSLVNQARASTIISENITTLPPGRGTT